MSDAQIISTDNGRRVEMPYKQACHQYVMGVALAFFMATTVLGFAILWRSHLPKSVWSTATPFFVVFSGVGFGLMAVSYTRPVAFYEFMEK